MLKDYSFKQRIFGNLIVSIAMGFGTILFMVVMCAIGVFNSVVPTSYFIIPSYFVLLTVYSELKVRKERKK